ncbi:TPA: N-6 DNA methylase [Proteus mirabilis]|nr:N-6 DNA methylase [Proteus mirabilis]HEK2081359.1 N-6 DNA methylase [Proteus mirabilis]
MILEKSIDEQVTSVLKAVERIYEFKEAEQMHMAILAVFLKYLSDVFNRKSQELASNQNTVNNVIDLPTAYQPIIYLPEKVRWENLTRKSGVVYENFIDIIRHLEHCSPILDNLSELIPIRNRNRPSNNALFNFFITVDRLVFDPQQCSENYSGDFFELLLNKFADKIGVKGGCFYTPPIISKLLVKLLQPKSNMTIYDPATGSGGMLVQSLNWLKKQDDLKNSPYLYGQEIIYSNVIIARINLLMHNFTYSDIKVGDTLIEPKHISRKATPFWRVEDNQLKTFDIVIANPPFSIKKYDEEYFHTDTYHRFIYGLSPRSFENYAFLMHMIASVKSDGKIGTIMPQSALFRGGLEKKIRKSLVKEDLIETVIGLPSGLLYGTGIPICILILNKNKADQHKGKILFIDASNSFESTKTMNKLKEDDINKIVDTFHLFKCNGTYSRIVTIEDLRNNNFDLSIRKYVDDSDASQKIKELLTHHADFVTYQLSNPNFVFSITIPTEEDTLVEGNFIYIHRNSFAKQVQLVLKCPNSQLRNYFRIEFNPDLFIKNYAKLYFQSELGRLILSHLPVGTSLPSLSQQYLKSLEIPVPSITVQKEVVRIASKLEIAKKQIDSFLSKLTTEPKQYKIIENNTNSMIYSLSTLSDATHLKQLISLGETRQMEFKQSFFANVDKIRSDDKTVDTDKGVQGEVIKDIASFMNTDGGTLLIGVNDYGKIIGVDHEKKRFKFKKMDNYFQKLGAQLESRLSKNYQQYCKLTEVEIDGCTVVRIDCKPASFPIFLDNEKFHVRTDTSSPALKGIEMIRYIQNHFKISLINEQK